jgi:hypothetical protein
MSPDEIAAALKDFDTGWLLVGREVPGLDGLRVRGSVQASGFKFRAVGQWDHVYIPCVLAHISQASDGSRVRVLIRPSLGQLLFLGVGFLALGVWGSPWFAIAIAAAAHVGSPLAELSSRG